MSAKVLTISESQLLDKIAIQNIGIPSSVLMENAGRAVAGEVLSLILGKKRSCVCVLCGVGNNAGDGFVAARHLLNAGVRTKVFLIGKPDQLKEDAAINYQILKNLKYPIRSIQKINKPTLREIQSADIIVDAVFGVGLNRKIREPFRSVIQTLNAQKKIVVAVDIPSGLDGTTGEIYGVCIKATATVTFSLPKRGFFRKEGPSHTGRIVVVDIGIPKQLFGNTMGEKFQ
jgi:NAD(P)H-hydrate epimerase